MSVHVCVWEGGVGRGKAKERKKKKKACTNRSQLPQGGKQSCLFSSVEEHLSSKQGVTGSNPVRGPQGVCSGGD